jgi:hypothetical protein
MQGAGGGGGKATDVREWFVAHCDYFAKIYLIRVPEIMHSSGQMQTNIYIQDAGNADNQ